MTRATACDAQPSQPEIYADLQGVAQQVCQEIADRLDPHQVDGCLNRMAAKLTEARPARPWPPAGLMLGREELRASLRHP